MALNLDAMRAKLDKLNGKDGSRKNFWRPEDGESNIRIVPTADGDPAVAILTVGDDADLSQAISLGCVRIHPDVMERLVLLPLGTPVQILG